MAPEILHKAERANLGVEWVFETSKQVHSVTPPPIMSYFLFLFLFFPRNSEARLSPSQLQGCITVGTSSFVRLTCMVPADSRLRWPIVQLESQNLLSAPCRRTYCNPWPGSLTAGWGLGRQGEVAEDWGGMLEACEGLGKGI